MVLRAAVIGAGRRGTTHTEAVGDLEDMAQVVGIADIDAARGQTLVSASAPYGKAYTDAAAMLRETEPQIVYVTTPPPLHKEQVYAAFAVGADVVLEKPISLNNADADEIGEAAERMGRKIHICHQLRYAGGASEMRDLLRGQPVALSHIWNYRMAPDIPGNWNRNWGGGHVVEWGIHYLDLLRYVMDSEPVEVYARYTDNVLPGTPNWDNWDAYALTVQWANGAVTGYASTYALKPGIPSSAGLAIIARDGKAEFGWGGATWTTPEGTQQFTNSRGEGERELSRAFLHAVSTGDASRVRQSFADAVKTHRFVMAANESAASGRPVQL